VLGVSAIGHCDDFVALKLRDFDGPMSGTCYLTQANPDLAAHYEIGKEIVTYCDVDECVDNARHLLSHEDERESIARAGRLRAEREHSWDKRFASVLGALRANSGMC
jgi:spore maturation protein CgeB